MIATWVLAREVHRVGDDGLGEVDAHPEPLVAVGRLADGQVAAAVHQLGRKFHKAHVIMDKEWSF